jgi:hypothetical protein
VSAWIVDLAEAGATLDPPTDVMQAEYESWALPAPDQ